jgi:hypothetical protein
MSCGNQNDDKNYLNLHGKPELLIREQKSSNSSLKQKENSHRTVVKPSLSSCFEKIEQQLCDRSYKKGFSETTSDKCFGINRAIELGMCVAYGHEKIRNDALSC